MGLGAREVPTWPTPDGVLVSSNAFDVLSEVRAGQSFSKYNRDGKLDAPTTPDLQSPTGLGVRAVSADTP